MTKGAFAMSLHHLSLHVSSYNFFPTFNLSPADISTKQKNFDRGNSWEKKNQICTNEVEHLPKSSK